VGGKLTFFGIDYGKSVNWEMKDAWDFYTLVMEKELIEFHHFNYFGHS
jgi:hypothetical protein